jgi:hypothetical protein
VSAKEALPGGSVKEKPDHAAATAEVIRFPQAKRPRGRPRKVAVGTPSTDDFDVIAQAVTAIPDALWPAAKERVMARAFAAHLAPSTVAVIGKLLELINRNEGRDWHGARTHAALLEFSEKTIKRAYSEGTKTGFLKRKKMVRSGTRASSIWHTTVPALVKAAIEIKAERKADESGTKRGTKKREQGTEKPKHGTINAPEQGTGKEASTGNKKPEAGDIIDHRILEENPDARGCAREGAAGGEPSQSPRAFVEAMAEAITEGDAADPWFAAFWRLRWAHGRGVPAAAAFSDETLMETLERAQFVSSGLLQGWVEARAAGNAERAVRMLAAMEDIDAYIAEATQLLGLHREMKEDVNLAMSLVSSPEEETP